MTTWVTCEGAMPVSFDAAGLERRASVRTVAATHRLSKSRGGRPCPPLEQLGLVDGLALELRRLVGGVAGLNGDAAQLWADDRAGGGGRGARQRVAAAGAEGVGPIRR